MKNARWTLLAGLVAIAAGLWLGSAAPATAQLSPGELSEAHAHLEGSSRCLDCHAPRQGVAPERCLDCHVALRQRVAAGEGLHVQPGFQRCETCHIEHHGREFELVYWEQGEAGGQDAFDHTRTGWPLTGAHRVAACRDCHRPENLQDPARLEAGKADLDSTFLGLSTTCRSCHDDEHRGQFQERGCTDCHTTSAWESAAGFRHDDTDFPLEGAHSTAACVQCHDTRDDRAGSFLQFTAVEHAACSDCHQDPHRGRLGPTCSDCHSPTDWRRVDTADFDHSRTRFPLTGLHRRLSCGSCHRGGATHEKLAFASCSDCHQDPHRGRLGPTCSSCHDTSGWTRVEDGLFDHNSFDHDLTRFPLRGEHVDVTCAGCHSSGRKARQRLDFDACSDCHGDPHRGQLRFSLAGGEPWACADCHTEEEFVPSTFGTDDHQETPFPLDGAHLAIACVDCHLLTEPEALPSGLRLQHSRGSAQTVRRFRFSATGCEACHGDPHDGATAAAACSDCHSTSSFRHVEAAGAVSGAGFDHGRSTGFELAGAHADLSCASCHGGARSEGAVRFVGIQSDCASCHADPHFGTTWNPGEASTVDCATCHRVSSWRDANFDHARETGFALEGAHARIACAACHVWRSSQQGEPQRRSEKRSQKSPPTTCEGCHDSSFISASSSTR